MSLITESTCEENPEQSCPQVNRPHETLSSKVPNFLGQGGSSCLGQGQSYLLDPEQISIQVQLPDQIGPTVKKENLQDNVDTTATSAGNALAENSSGIGMISEVVSLSREVCLGAETVDNVQVSPIIIVQENPATATPPLTTANHTAPAVLPGGPTGHEETTANRTAAALVSGRPSGHEGSNNLIAVIKAEKEDSEGSVQHNRQTGNTNLSQNRNRAKKSLQQLSTEAFFRCGNQNRTCLFRTESVAEFDTHLKTAHSDEGLFLCVHCGSEEMGSDSLLQHLEGHLRLQRQLLYCTESTCDFHSYSPEEVLGHIVSHPTVTSFPCWRCPATFSSVHGFSTHVKQNLIHVVCCPHCPAKDTDRGRVLAHISSSHPGKGRMMNIHALLLCQERTLSDWHTKNMESSRPPTSTSQDSDVSTTSAVREQAKVLVTGTSGHHQRVHRYGKTHDEAILVSDDEDSDDITVKAAGQDIVLPALGTVVTTRPIDSGNIGRNSTDVQRHAKTASAATEPSAAGSSYDSAPASEVNPSATESSLASVQNDDYAYSSIQSSPASEVNSERHQVETDRQMETSECSLEGEQERATRSARFVAEGCNNTLAFDNMSTLIPCPYCKKNRRPWASVEKEIRAHMRYKPFSCPHCTARSFQSSSREAVEKHIRTDHPSLRVKVRVTKEPKKEERLRMLLQKAVSMTQRCAIQKSAAGVKRKYIRSAASLSSSAFSRAGTVVSGHRKTAGPSTSQDNHDSRVRDLFHRIESEEKTFYSCKLCDYSVETKRGYDHSGYTRMWMHARNKHKRGPGKKDQKVKTGQMAGLDLLSFFSRQSKAVSTSTKQKSPAAVSKRNRKHKRSSGCLSQRKKQGADLTSGSTSTDDHLRLRTKDGFCAITPGLYKCKICDYYVSGKDEGLTNKQAYNRMWMHVDKKHNPK